MVCKTEIKKNNLRKSIDTNTIARIFTIVSDQRIKEIS